MFQPWAAAAVVKLCLRGNAGSKDFKGQSLSCIAIYLCLKSTLLFLSSVGQTELWDGLSRVCSVNVTDFVPTENIQRSIVGGGTWKAFGQISTHIPRKLISWHTNTSNSYNNWWREEISVIFRDSFCFYHNLGADWLHIVYVNALCAHQLI